MFALFKSFSMFIHPQIDPVFFSIGPISFRWYGLMYLLGFIAGIFILQFQLSYQHIQKQGWRYSDIDDLILYIVLGVILGGRLGYVFLYRFSYYSIYPLKILAIWEGGMSFHGGMLGVGVSLLIYNFQKKKTLHFLQVTEFIVPSVPFGIAIGRFGNFINGELWGRVTSKDVFWAIGFPQASLDDFIWFRDNIDAGSQIDLYNVVYHFGRPILPRHPSQLYEMMLEGVFLFFILLWFARTARPMGFLTGLFLGWYGFVRFIVEFTREPDAHIGLLAFDLSIGQWLSLPMIFVGCLLIFFSRKEKRILC